MIDLRAFFASDLHGSEIVMNKLVNAAKFYNVKNIVVGGDLTGKVLVPIVKEGDRYNLELFGEQKKVRERDLEEIKRELRVAGEYYRIMDRSEYNEIETDEGLLKKAFIEEMIGSLESFMKRADERLPRLGARIFLMAGNDDYEEVAKYLDSHSYESVINIDKRITDIEGYQLLGYGYSNPTPWHTPRERSEEVMLKELSALAKKTDSKKSVFVIHAPPFNTKIDVAPKLTKDIKQVASWGVIQTGVVGSTATREIIENFSPIAGLHGHIHESSGIDYIESKVHKKVPVLNPGSDYGSGILNGIILDFEGDKLKSYNFTRG